MWICESSFQDLVIAVCRRRWSSGCCFVPVFVAVVVVVVVLVVDVVAVLVVVAIVVVAIVVVAIVVALRL